MEPLLCAGHVPDRPWLHEAYMLVGKSEHKEGKGVTYVRS